MYLSCTVTVPVNAESKEQLYVDRCEIADKYAADNKARIDAWEALSKKYGPIDSIKKASNIP